jgi:hypothetical protein
MDQDCQKIHRQLQDLNDSFRLAVKIGNGVAGFGYYVIIQKK